MSHVSCALCGRPWETRGDHDLCLDGDHQIKIDWEKKYKEAEDCISTMYKIPGHNKTTKETIMTIECKFLLARVYELERKLNGRE